MEVTITSISRKERTSKAGKPFTSVGIRCEQYGDKWLSGFGNADNANWKVGDRVEIEVYQKGEYLNFTTKKGEKGGDRFSTSAAEIKNLISLKIEPKLDKIIALLETQQGKDPDAINAAFDEVTEDDSPFK